MEQRNRVFFDKVADCQRACNMCFDACLKEENVKMMAECIRLDRECADLCGIALDFAGRDSIAAKDLIALCGKVCEACAAECEKHSHMEHCQECARACRECAKACNALM